MKIVMVGEAATHRDEIAAELGFEADYVALPREAHESPEWDQRIDGADVLVAMRFKRPNKAEVPRFRLLHVPGAGLDGIDFSLMPEGSVACNVFEHEIPMAEYALASMLEHEVGLAAARASFDSELFASAYLGRKPRGELYGKTVLIVGFGRIGQAVAVRAQAFGLKIIALSSRALNGQLKGPCNEAYTPSQINEILPRADYVVLSCPLDDETRGSFGADQFQAMKDDAVLINIARAAVVDEDALYQALVDKQIAKAFLDVWYAYPAGSRDSVAPARHRFEELPNAFCTPHISGWTHGLFERRYAFIAANIRRLKSGEKLHNVVYGEG
ncbi:Phosphoglycerate dehydrogenase [Pseudomonas flavescens]|uniref:Phosphoglycerate dehydrogenase n=1 Tax=Phytopseudomonas flavescens TaxID=29435 RepID=A0A1G8BXH8_9GAMM|nr:2-hydroxyacid dehydrogenase [Pseudomonas flavescens]SDH37773.1 Phosphoglycerate dehydrogenase [Pseudomonas flavescens]